MPKKSDLQTANHPPVASSPNAPVGGDAAEPGGAASVDAIRDIIFGTQMRDYEKRFDRLEGKLQRDSERLRDDLHQRLDDLERFVKAEVASLVERLRVADAERTQADQQQATGLRELDTTIGGKIAQLEEVSETARRELREQILAQSKELAEAIHRNSEATNQSLEEAVEALRAAKTDRSMLAELLAEMALRLSGEPGTRSDQTG